MTERTLEFNAHKSIETLVRLLRQSENPTGFIEVAVNIEFKSTLILLENGTWRVTSSTAKGYRDIQTSRKRNLEEVLEVFALLTDPRMEKFVGPPFLYDDDWRMYHRRREEYVRLTRQEILASFVAALKRCLLQLSQSNPPPSNQKD